MLGFIGAPGIGVRNVDCAGDMVVGIVFIAADVNQVVAGVNRCNSFLTIDEPMQRMIVAFRVYPNSRSVFTHASQNLSIS